MSIKKNGPINVLVFFATNNIGGPGKGLFQLIKNSDANDVRFTVCNFRHPRQRTFEFLDAARDKGVDIQLITQRFALDPLMIRDALRIAREREFDVVQSHGYKTHILAWIVSKKLGIPWVALSHGWTSENIKIRFYNSLERFFLRLPDSAIGVSTALYDELTDIRKAGRSLLVLNAIEDNHVAPDIDRAFVRKELGVAGDEFLIGVVGRLSHEKGQDQFIEVMRRTKANSKIKAVILGEGHALDNLVNQVREAELQDNIQFIGYQEETSQFFGAMDLCVLPSRNEGLPNVVLEAQLAGVPVVAFDVGGVCEVIDDTNTGWLISAGNVEKMAERIAQLSADPTSLARVAKCALAALFPKFSVSRRCEQFEMEYRVLVDSGMRG